MTTRPQAGFWQIWNMCFGFAGLQFALALQNSNMSRIFQTLGAATDDIPALWIAAPLTGLLVQPLVGYWSDRTWGRFGRRRPYFVGGALLSAIALLAMPNARALWVAATLLWILDASINVSMGPFRSFVGDQLDSSQRAHGYAMQTFFIAAGSVVASLAPYALAAAGVDNVAAIGAIPDTVRYAFYAGACVLVASMAWSACTREYRPDELAVFDERTEEPAITSVPARRAWLAWIAAGIAVLGVVAWTRAQREAYVLGAGLAGYGVLLALAERTRPDGALAGILRDMRSMPPTMRRLLPVQFFSWFSLFAMWIYTTAAVTEVQFGATDPRSAAYNDGANWVGVLFAAYNAFALAVAAIIPAMTRRFGLRASHVFNLAIGGIGLASIPFVRDPHWLLASMLGVGFAWASILSLPYALLADSVPARKMGVYMGIFNLSIVVPQLLAAGVLATLVRHVFEGRAVGALLVGGFGLLLAGACTLRVPAR